MGSWHRTMTILSSNLFCSNIAIKLGLTSDVTQNVEFFLASQDNLTLTKIPTVVVLFLKRSLHQKLNRMKPSFPLKLNFPLQPPSLCPLSAQVRLSFTPVTSTKGITVLRMKCHQMETTILSDPDKRDIHELTQHTYS